MSSGRGYAILATPRSGSSHLCALLRSTGQLGNPLEYLNRWNTRKYIADFDDSAPIWHQITQESATPNGVFGIKIFADHLDDGLYPDVMRKVMDLPLIFLKRNDKLGQAISFVRAEQTQSWSQKEKAQREPAYDGKAITKKLTKIVYDEAVLEKNVALLGRTPLRLHYEDYVHNPQQAIDAIAAMMGVTGAQAVMAKGMAIQRDALSEAWRTRYLGEHADMTRLDRFGADLRWTGIGRQFRPVVQSVLRLAGRRV